LYAAHLHTKSNLAVLEITILGFSLEALCREALLDLQMNGFTGLGFSGEAG